ncbi:fibrinogen-related protein [Cupriavidus sp. TMH.W2]|uniref:fibrinogen-related protein n=1 Tax=Cupriavidus sp. TMH.W2 TaxID=3434465 RepID=UPI003D76B074
MKVNIKKSQGGYAVVPLVLATVAAIAATVAMSTSVVKTLVMSQSTAKARTLTETALAAAATQLGAMAAFSDNNVALLPTVQNAAFAPSGGGQLPAGLNVPTLDGWGNPIGYCLVSGVSPSDATAALVSASKDMVFQTPCNLAVAGQALGDDTVRVINSASLLKGRTGSMHHGRPLPNLSALNALQYITVGEIRPVMDDGSGKAALFFNPTGQAGKWVALQSQGSQMSPLLKGLVGYWPMDEVSGVTAFDAVGSHDLTFSSGVAAPGVFSNGRLISGSASVPLADIQASGSPQATIAMWLDSATYGSYPMLWSFDTYDIYYNKDYGYIGFNTVNGEVRGVPVPTTGKHLFVFVMDTRTNGGDNFAPDERIYIDGVKQTLSLAGLQPVPSNRTFGNTLWMGGNSASPSAQQLSNTFYDDFAAWKRALTDDEVAQLMQSGRSLGELMTIQAGFVQRGGAWQPMAEKPYPMCLDYRNKGAMADGVYLISPPGSAAPFQVRCDMSRDGGGWTVFQRRYSGGIDFYRPWSDYVAGFGALTGEFWLGLDKLNLLTSSPRSLRVDLGRYNSQVAYAKYTTFSVGSAATNYLLSVSGFSGGLAGDSMTVNGMPFSTYDADHDSWSGNCAATFHGAWWYGACHGSNLNGGWLNGPHSSYADGVEWSLWTGQYESLTYTEMKVR